MAESGGNWDKVFDVVRNLKALEGKPIQLGSLPVAMDFVKVEKTPKEALTRARMTAARKGQAFVEPSAMKDPDNEGKIISQKLANDIIEGIINKHG